MGFICEIQGPGEFVQKKAQENFYIIITCRWIKLIN